MHLIVTTAISFRDCRKSDSTISTIMSYLGTKRKENKKIKASAGEMFDFHSRTARLWGKGGGGGRPGGVCVCVCGGGGGSPEGGTHGWCSLSASIISPISHRLGPPHFFFFFGNDLPIPYVCVSR